MHKVTKHEMRGAEPAAVTPCHADPERYFPEDPLPDPEAVAACWSCFFQRDCALRALTLDPQPEHGIWGGYRLAPGPGLKRTRRQLRIIAGIDMGPALSPGAQIDTVLEGRARAIDRPGGEAAVDDSAAAADLAEVGSSAEVIPLPERGSPQPPHHRYSPLPFAAATTG